MFGLVIILLLSEDQDIARLSEGQGATHRNTLQDNAKHHNTPMTQATKWPMKTLRGCPKGEAGAAYSNVDSAPNDPVAHM